MLEGKRSLPLILLLGAVVLLAGCTDPTDQVLAEDSGTAQIEAGQARNFELNAEGDISLEYEASVSQGPDIDVFVLDSQNYERYQNAEDFEYHPCSSLGTGSGSGTCDLVAGAWHLVLDNTDQGEASPATVSTGSQTATVNYGFTARPA